MSTVGNCRLLSEFFFLLKNSFLSYLNKDLEEVVVILLLVFSKV